MAFQVEITPIAENRINQAYLKNNLIALTMTDLLEQAMPDEAGGYAIAKLKHLPPSQQDSIAAIILEEIEDEYHWNEAFNHSPEKIAKLAAQAMAEYHAGKTQELDPDRL